MAADKDKPLFVGKRRKIPKVNSESADSAAPGFAARRKLAQETVGSLKFDVAMGIVIVLSAICIGVEQAWEIEGRSTVLFQVLESIFLVIYIFEFSVRWLAHGPRCLQDNWTKFDLFLIVIGVLTFWILEPIFASMNQPDVQSKFGPLMMLRAVRLFRLAKIARLFSRIREFWLLIRGLMNCAPLVVYTFIIFLFCLYGFACVAVEVIAKHPLVEEDEDFRDHAMKYFGTLMKALLTLLRYASLDNMSAVHELLVEKDPWLAVYFVALTFIVSLVLFHLLGAVIFASTLDQNQQEMDGYKTEQAETWNNLISGLRDLFFRLDEDMSGQLSKAELMNIDPADMQELSAALGGRPMSPSQVFDALDVDGSGEISIDEFFDGIRDVVLDRAALENKRMEKQVETIHWRLKEMFSAQYEMKVQLAKLFADDPASPSTMRRPWKGETREVPQLESALLARRVNGSHEPKKEGNDMPKKLNFQCEDVPSWARDLTDKLRQSWEQSLEQVTKVVNEAARSKPEAAQAPKLPIRRTVYAKPAQSKPSRSASPAERSSSKERQRNSISEAEKGCNSSESLRAQSTSLPDSATPPEPPSVMSEWQEGQKPTLENPKGTSAVQFLSGHPPGQQHDGHPAVEVL